MAQTKQQLAVKEEISQQNSNELIEKKLIFSSIMNNSIEIIREYQSLPTKFFEIDLYVLSMDMTRKNVIFSKDAIQKAFKTLPYTPIVAKTTKKGVKYDFNGHESKPSEPTTLPKLVSRDTEIVGVILEDSSPRFVTKKDENGKDTEFLVVRGVIWGREDNVINVFMDNPVKKISVEIENIVYEISEEMNVINDFNFWGVCLIGDNYTTGLNGAESYMNFTTEELDDTIKSKVEEFHNIKTQMEFTSDINIQETKSQETIDVLTDKNSVHTNEENNDSVDKDNNLVTQEEVVKDNINGGIDMKENTENISVEENVNVDAENTTVTKKEYEMSENVKQSAYMQILDLKKELAMKEEEIIQLKEKAKTFESQAKEWEVKYNEFFNTIEDERRYKVIQEYTNILQNNKTFVELVNKSNEYTSEELKKEFDSILGTMCINNIKDINNNEYTFNNILNKDAEPAPKYNGQYSVFMNL